MKEKLTYEEAIRFGTFIERLCKMGETGERLAELLLVEFVHSHDTEIANGTLFEERNN